MSSNAKALNGVRAKVDEGGLANLFGLLTVVDCVRNCCLSRSVSV